MARAEPAGDVAAEVAPAKRRGRPRRAPEATAGAEPVAPPVTRQRRPMGDEHKAALAEGRESGRAVRNYLEALENNRPRRGRRRTRESIEKRLAAIEETIGNVDPLTRLMMVQERIELTNEMLRIDEEPDLSGYEEAFIQHAKGFGERKGITYLAWREIGVPAHVLREAGIQR